MLRTKEGFFEGACVQQHTTERKGCQGDGYESDSELAHDPDHWYLVGLTTVFKALFT